MVDKETATIVLVVITLLAVLATIYPLIPLNTERYSSIGLLGPQKTIGNYTTSLSVGQPFLLYCFVQNNQGSVEYYTVYVKLGNISTVITNSTSARAPIISTYSYVLDNGANVTFPMNLALHQSGTNLRIIFELWMFEPTISNFTYTGDYNQLWVNVTS